MTSERNHFVSNALPSDPSLAKLPYNTRSINSYISHVMQQDVWCDVTFYAQICEDHTFFKLVHMHKVTTFFVQSVEITNLQDTKHIKHLVCFRFQFHSNNIQEQANNLKFYPRINCRI